MPDYRRNRIPSGTYFFTVNLLDRRRRLLVEHVEALRAVVRVVRNRQPFHIDAWVVLPEHLHCLWTLPPGDADYSRRWKAIKTAFAKAVPREEPLSEVRRARHERGIWQRRFWEHTISDERDYAAHMDYIHFNPVKHGWVERVVDWPYSSFHRLVRAGVYSLDWGGVDKVEGVFGERDA